MHDLDILDKIEIGKNFAEQIEVGKIGLSEVLLGDTKIENYIEIVAVDKKTGGRLTLWTQLYGKARICRHASFSSYWTYNINELIPPINYKMHVPLCKAFCLQLIRSGRWCLMFKTDGSDAFRQLGMSKLDWKYMGYKFMNKSFCDTRDIYGTKSASKHTQDFGNVLIKSFKCWIQQFLLKNEDISNLVYIDDHVGFIKSHPMSNRIREKVIMNLFFDYLHQCGYIEQPEKRCPISWIMEICGLIYDSADMTVGPGPKKKKKVLLILIIIICYKMIMSDVFESLLGSLTWMAALMWPGTAFLRRFRLKLTIHKQSHGEDVAPIYFLDHDVKDARFWILYAYKCDRVSVYDVIGRSQKREYILYTDGATNGENPNWNPGIGAFFDGHWGFDKVPGVYLEFYHKFLSDNNCIIHSQEQRIAHFEALAIVAALQSFKQYFEPNSHLILRCDNKHYLNVYGNRTHYEKDLHHN